MPGRGPLPGPERSLEDAESVREQAQRVRRVPRETRASALPAKEAPNAIQESPASAREEGGSAATDEVRDEVVPEAPAEPEPRAAAPAEPSHPRLPLEIASKPELVPPPQPTRAEESAPNVTLSWNAWLQAQSSTRLRTSYSNPVLLLEPATTYQVVLHLAPFSYGSEAGGIASAAIADSARKRLDEMLSEIPPDVNELELDALILYDGSYYEKPDSEIKPLKINVARLRAATAGKRVDSSSVFDMLAKNPEQSFVLGKVSFTIRTKPAADFPRDPLAGSIAISLWDKDRRIPWDEVSFAVCAAPGTCVGVRRASFGFDGFDALRLSLGKQPPAPEGAIHLIELENHVLHGVFRHSGDPSYYTWPLAKPLREFQETVQSQLKNLQSIGENGRRNAGEALLGQLFPEIGNSRALEARKQFVKFVRPYLNAQPYADEMPVLFFRIAGRQYVEPSLWPLPFISVNPDARSDGVFLGRYFRIESPLTNQNYGASNCVSDWILVGPATEGVTLNARKKLEARIIYGADTNPRAIRIAGAELRMLDNMADFRTFIHGEKDDDDELNANIQSLVNKSPALMHILSHHDSNRVYFTDGDGGVYSGQVRRTFAQPSAVILNGCGTGQPGASDFIDRLNRAGIQAAIATVSEVEAEMAGDFLECFAKQIEEAPEEGLPIGIAYVKTLHCLDLAGYGSKALNYSLLGNSGLKVCKPGLQR